MSGKAYSYTDKKDLAAYSTGKTREQWQKELDPRYLEIFLNDPETHSTQLPGKGLLDVFSPKSGQFVCTACDKPLYAASHKLSEQFACGWTAFNGDYPDAVGVQPDPNDKQSSFFRRSVRDEIFCTGCGGHLGHRFNDHKPFRDCVNSICLTFANTDGLKNIDERLTDKKQKVAMEVKCERSSGAVLENLRAGMKMG